MKCVWPPHAFHNYTIAMIKMHYVFEFYYKNSTQSCNIRSIALSFFFELLDARFTLVFVEIVVNLIHIKIYYAKVRLR